MVINDEGKAMMADVELQLGWMVLRDQQRSSGRGVDGLGEVLRYGDTQETETGDKEYLYYADISFTVR